VESDSKLGGASTSTADMPVNVKSAPECSNTSEVRKVKISSQIGGTPNSQQYQDQQHYKAKQALPHIAVLLKCILFLTMVFAVFGIGLRLLSLGLKSDLDRAEVALRDHSNVQYREQLLYIRSIDVTSTQLRARFMEKHEDCLVRGMHHVDQELFGIGLQYPDIRNQSIEWTTENCGRMHYALKVVMPLTQKDDLTY
jgi:hypothetical protein